MIREAIIKLSKKEDLSYEMAQEVMNEIMSGQASDIQKSAYLTALAMKGETIDEITASAAGMRAHCLRLLNDMDVLEIVGTGGDNANSFNISTVAASFRPLRKRSPLTWENASGRNRRQLERATPAAQLQSRGAKRGRFQPHNRKQDPPCGAWSCQFDRRKHDLDPSVATSVSI